MKQMIIPAIISNDNIELNDALKKAKLVSNFAQIDVMDGEFVENKSNFFNLKIDDISLHLEAHLMVNEHKTLGEVQCFRNKTLFQCDSSSS